MPTREHLYKARRKDNGEWVKGYYCPTPYTRFPCKPAIYPIDTINSNWRGVEVDPETVCECTGLTDKNGKKIFEGDILSAHLDSVYIEDETIVTVVWDEFNWGLKQGKYLPDLLAESDGDVWEVVGNIYDNPELVEVRK